MNTITREFTKEQLIARINQVTAINKFRIKRDPDADGLAMDNELLAIALASLEAEPKKEPELKMAHLIKKFYERYPLAEFKSDTERSEALGYFMAGAELQCFGEFINYAELMGDE
jgi:hypothetical protein